MPPPSVATATRPAGGESPARVADAPAPEIADGCAIAKAINYSLGRWQALTRYIDDGDLPIDNNWVENRIRPISVGHKTGTQGRCVPGNAPPSS
jgi:hypothetical protein